MNSKKVTRTFSELEWAVNQSIMSAVRGLVNTDKDDMEKILGIIENLKKYTHMDDTFASKR